MEYKETMKVSVDDLASLDVSEVVIESVDLSLYIAHALIADQEHVIADRKGKVLKTRNLLEMQRAPQGGHLRVLSAPAQCLR